MEQSWPSWDPSSEEYTRALAKDFVALLKQGKHDEAGNMYNADTIVSYESMDSPMAVCRGKDAVRKKGEWWVANHEVHEDRRRPLFQRRSIRREFLCRTVKESGERRKMNEFGLYPVENGKIVEERFFY